MWDVRWLFLLVAAAIVFALLVPVEQPIISEDAVQRAYEAIESLEEGSAVLLAMDFDPQSKAELEPMSLALLRHCLRRNLKVIGMTFWPMGNALANDIFRRAGEEFPNKQLGRDYVYLGYQPGGFPQVITAMSESIPRTFPQDYRNRSTAGMPIFQEVRSLKHIRHLIDMAAGDSPSAWILYAGDKLGIEMGVGCTAVCAPDLFVRLDAGQIKGLIAGMRGAADYETLIERPALGTRGMFAQSLVHVLIVALVIVGNVLYFRSRSREHTA